MNSINKLKHTLYQAVGGDTQYKSLWQDAINTYMDCTTLSLKTTAVATGTNPFLVFEPIDFPANYIYNDLQVYAPTQLQSGSGVFGIAFTSFDTPLTPDNVPFTDYDDYKNAYNSSFTTEQTAFMEANPYGVWLDSFQNDFGNLYGGQQGSNKQNVNFHSSKKREAWGDNDFGVYLNTDYSLNNNAENKISSVDHKLYVAMLFKSPTPFNNIPFTVTLNMAPFKPL